MVMFKLKTKIRQLIYFLRRDFLTVQNIISTIAIALCLYFLAGAITATTRNWSLQTKINSLLAQEELVKLEVEKLKLEQQYYNTEEYQELVARKKLGKMTEGETMVILSDNSESAKNKYKDADKVSVSEKSNFAQWLDLLF